MQMPPLGINPGLAGVFLGEGPLRYFSEGTANLSRADARLEDGEAFFAEHLSRYLNQFEFSAIGQEIEQNFFLLGRYGFVRRKGIGPAGNTDGRLGMRYSYRRKVKSGFDLFLRAKMVLRPGLRPQLIAARRLDHPSHLPWREGFRTRIFLSTSVRPPEGLGRMIFQSILHREPFRASRKWAYGPRATIIVPTFPVR